ncbi:DUF192 domain-containing protein [Dethiobacter alkaliphilus]|uniref:DUF192 domain-containing protein n=1 Tax=Dethiobacter alkaliphilus AHT 1 TaxID=555088 RepID=C0GE97_DETAL|nr:DUF192 domain-containing protein [Dethiobacter alkaliphilus]EEG78391.1 protein of unknown function DUF192 [Dethiobacter alkaliphilus AHT 1]
MADSFFLRLKGLLGKKSLPEETGLVITPCKAVHTVGMAFAIDVAFVDDSDTVCALWENMQPYRFGKTVKKARYVIEAPAGTFAQKGVAVGSMVNFVS